MILRERDTELDGYTALMRTALDYIFQVQEQMSKTTDVKTLVSLQKLLDKSIEMHWAAINTYDIVFESLEVDDL